jgi:hypothetical protein
MTACALARVLPADRAIRVIETADAAPRGALSTLPPCAASTACWAWTKPP